MANHGPASFVARAQPAQQEFIEACINLGLPLHRIIMRHLAPNVLGPVGVYSTLTIPAVMLLEAS